ncbi:type II toxin-antitoxin system RelB/DinJ family antitoxin [Lentilactobacillus sp. IMAU92037]|uniref:type II toxin-antitoxin system RelB/DinJ family antitoxin n=1 Tax=Lentilactobacillus TaxID=2767893 RepID=UPI001C266E8A|nr:MULTISPECIES: type II toxin-antitoxin system RelB/DinJ family antitoxin [Lentilactobacillus]MBU9788193.1 type II toxin-antitoxin system RelB/DinJ family antitoxin [Lentilactobacillus dabitei]MBV0929565.1 type II toxin-antitoxin system RelB/DinJ family antitoxin [Lentilactobacillus dabitei]MDM7515098.1 type II toxin-antitoxin system RelB/DinJ family antitoxin [Lentilactobacillus sp. TOM.63]
MAAKKTETLKVRINSHLKTETEKLLSNMGLTYSDAVTLFSRAIVNEGKIPFEIQSDPFYSAENQESLRKSINQLENGTGKQHNLIDEDQ